MRAVNRWVVDCAIAAAAVWTVAYHLGLAFGAPVRPLLAAWLVVTVPCAVALASARRRAGRGAGSTADQSEAGRSGEVERERVTSPSRVRAAVIVTAGVLAAVAGAAGLWPMLVAFGALAVVAAVPWLRTAGRGRPAEPPLEGRVPQWQEGVALLVAVGLGVLSVFIVRPDADDVFYVNRSVWVAEHGRLPVGDVLFGDGGRILPGMAPVSSIEAFAGSVARVVHLPAASVVWYLLPPAVTVLAVLALWQLVKAWAPRRPLAGLLLALVFLLWSGASAASFGSFHLVRAWQGKAILVSLALPALWLYLTEWARDRSRLALLLAVTAGVAGLGFSSSAAFVVPLTAVAAGLGLVLLGRLRDTPPLALVTAYPLVGGLLVGLTLGAPAGESGTLQAAPLAWRWVVGVGAAGVVGAAAVWCGPLLVRGVVPAAFAWGAAAVAVILLLPGAMNLAALLTGSAPVLWRMLWVLPAPALVGLVASVRVPSLGRLARWPRPAVRGRVAVLAPGASLALLLVLTAVPVWAGVNRASLVSRPQWKSDPASGRVAAAVLRAYPSAHLVLAPPGVMRAMTARTAEVKVVDPRGLYLATLRDGTAGERQLLSALAARRSVPPPDRLRAALAAVPVDVACLQRGNVNGLAALRAAGLAGERTVRSLVCLTPRHGAPAAGGPDRTDLRPQLRHSGGPVHRGRR
ncbi:DUF6077 domain-containing protein [Rhizomonospora bruguierae]|uniref:DUF6077 domain-containing protein n=1 Tax=Rhizomonospora bruguierae TaxID=1581705 RepID=UPI001BD0D1A1|nr:DUF6077 domain-containing protein [Micromonospora sp. NBRC 107566]